MFNYFHKRPTYVNREFSDLSLTLLQDREEPTYKREFLDEKKLDFSIQSLKHLDAYLEAVHVEPPQEDDLVRLVLRSGAYLGEVIRRNSPNEWNWVAFKEAAKYSAFANRVGLFPRDCRNPMEGS